MRDRNEDVLDPLQAMIKALFEEDASAASSFRDLDFSVNAIREGLKTCLGANMTFSGRNGTGKSWNIVSPASNISYGVRISLQF